MSDQPLNPAALRALYDACLLAKDYLIDDLVEPGRTVFWKLIDALKLAGWKVPSNDEISATTFPGNTPEATDSAITAEEQSPEPASALSATTAEREKLLHQALAVLKNNGDAPWIFVAQEARDLLREALE
jgi:hypothetical protein